MPSSRPRRSRSRGALIGLLVAAAAAAGCQAVAYELAKNELRTRLGPCDAPMDSVRRALGRSRHQSETDSSGPTGDRVFRHDWYYPERGDTLVSFAWRQEGGSCTVTTSLGPPVEESVFERPARRPPR